MIPLRSTPVPRRLRLRLRLRRPATVQPPRRSPGGAHAARAAIIEPFFPCWEWIKQSESVVGDAHGKRLCAGGARRPGLWTCISRIQKCGGKRLERIQRWFACACDPCLIANKEYLLALPKKTKGNRTRLGGTNWEGIMQWAIVISLCFQICSHFFFFLQIR
jgi:hypothetical protein